MSSITPVDSTAFDPRRIASIRHDYHLHPLLQIDELSALARRLMPFGNCRFVSGVAKLDSPFDHRETPYDGKSLDQVLERIEEPGSWIAIYDAQHDHVVRDMLRGVRDQIQELVLPDQRIDDIRAFIFVSAPPSVTPFHIDRENNFWLQLRGRKTITVFDHRDRDVVAAKDVERFIILGGLQNVKLRHDLLARGQRYECGPGDGVYFPSTTPHMTETTPDPTGVEKLSISVGMVFYTDVTRRHARAHAMNYMLRGLGVSPRQPGENDTLDRVKAFTGRGLWAVRRACHRLFGRRDA